MRKKKEKRSDTVKFDVNHHIISVTETGKFGKYGYSVYEAIVEGKKFKGYECNPGCHLAVLLSVLDDCGRLLDKRTINWPEDQIKEVD